MTIKQKQCLLAYLGFYQGQVDGKWGPLSRAATQSFQRTRQLNPDGIFGPATEKTILEAIASGETGESGSFWKNLRHFRREDFRCKCGGKHCSGFPAEMAAQVVAIAEAAVDHFGGEIDPERDLISGLRCPAHNEQEGGVAGSRHIRGKAIDLRLPGVPASALLAFVKTQNIRYAYAINGTNVHFDIE